MVARALKEHRTGRIQSHRLARSPSCISAALTSKLAWTLPTTPKPQIHHHGVRARERLVRDLPRQIGEISFVRAPSVAF